LDTARIETLCRQVKALHDRGIDVILVSSGAVGLGMGKLDLKERPKDLATQQACAAVGQTILINTWQLGFDRHDLTVAQILLTREDLRARHRHNAVFNTIERLLALGIVPIVNENDTVSAREIKFGDNDTLSALVASIAKADQLFILSNIPGLIDMQGSGEVVPYIEKMTPEIEAMAQGTNAATSVGGMVSKLSAAKIAHRAGCGVTIGSGQDSELFNKLLAGESVGTYFAPSPSPIKSHKRWMAIQDHTHGTVTIDSDAATAILNSGKSLIFAGITASEGDFEEDDVVKICTADGKVIAHGLASVNAEDLVKLISFSSEMISTTIPELRTNVIIHRDNIVLLD
jgi:glutamate 5-kinase